MLNHLTRLDYALGKTTLKDSFEDCTTIQEKSLFLIVHPVESAILPDGSGGLKWFPKIGNHILKQESESGYESQAEALSAGSTFQLDITTLLQDCPFALEVFDYLLKIHGREQSNNGIGRAA